MSTITRTVALAAFVGALGTSGFASAKTQETTHKHAAQVERTHGQQSNEKMQGTDIPNWMRNFDRSGNGSSGGQY
jgi:hypothetical protein